MTEVALKRPTWLEYITMNAYFFGLGYLWNSLHLFVLLVILPLMIGQARQGSALGILRTIGLLIAIVVMPAAGALSDRLTSRWGRRRPFLILGTALDMIFLAGIAWSFGQPLTASGIAMPEWFPLTTNADFWALLFLAYLGLQFSSNLANGPIQGLIPDLVPEEHRGVASGIKSFIDIAVLVVAALVTGQLLGRQDWSIVFAAQVVIGVIALLLVVTLAINVFGIRERQIAADEIPSRTVGAAIKRSFAISRARDPDYIWLLVSRLFILAGIGIVSNFATFYFKDVVLAGQPNAEHLAPQLQSQLLTVAGIMIVLVTVPAGVLSDRWGRKPFSAIGGIVGLVGAVFLLFARYRPLFALGPLVVTDLLLDGLLIGFGMGLFNSTAWAWATDLVPANEAARYLGISNLATGGSQILAVFGGFVLDIVNAQSPGAGYNVIFLIGAVYFALGVIVLPKVRETRGKRVVGGERVARGK
ncbi:MAG: MFS transporter [Chloroflexota bacterium]|nr:MFS transporter [Chloroflexota bacterium]